MDVKTYTVATELMLDNGLTDVPRKDRINEEWSMFFNPIDYWKDHPGLTLENSVLSFKKLQLYGK